MPTFNQLVRKGREVVEKKSTAPEDGTPRRESPSTRILHKKEAFVLLSERTPLRSLTPRCVKPPELS